MGQSIEAAPGTLAWLESQPTSEVQGRTLPACHRVPEGGRLLDQPDDGSCQLVRPDGRRCRAPRIARYGLCLVHSGGGAQDMAMMRARAVQATAKLRARRELLGVGPARVGSARQHARLAALERAQDLAEALVHGPLDDRKLGSVERQVAAVRVLDAVEPLQSVSLEVSLPGTAEDVAGLGWEDMLRLAEQLDDGVATE